MTDTDSKIVEPILRLDRAYSASDTAEIFGMSTRMLDERVKRGWISPIRPVSPRYRRYSGFAIAKRLGWPLTDDPRDYIPRPKPASATGYPGLERKRSLPCVSKLARQGVATEG